MSQIYGGCRVYSLASSVALKIPIALIFVREESPWNCQSNGAKLVLFRLSNDFGSNWPVVLLIFFVHKNPVRRLNEFVSEHSRLLLIFGIKKSGSRPNFLKFDLGTCQDDAGTNCVSLSFLVPELFKSIAESFYKSGLFFNAHICLLQ